MSKSDPRRMGPVAQELVKRLRKLKISHAEWGKSKHGWVKFHYLGRDLKFRFACSPRANAAPDTMAKFDTLILETAQAHFQEAGR